MKSVEQRYEDRTYRGIGPHRADARAATTAVRIVDLIRGARPDTVVEHIGSTAVPGLEGKNVVDLQITAEPGEVPEIVRVLLGLGFAPQTGRDPWPPERPMLEGTYACEGAVFAVHCHVVPTTDPEVWQMIAFRDLLRADPSAREAYTAEKRRIAAETDDSLEYTDAKTTLIRRLLGAEDPPTAV